MFEYVSVSIIVLVLALLLMLVVANSTEQNGMTNDSSQLNSTQTN